jgi:hypothetical protein
MKTQGFEVKVEGGNTKLLYNSKDFIVGCDEVLAFFLELDEEEGHPLIKKIKVNYQDLKQMLSDFILEKGNCIHN